MPDEVTPEVAPVTDGQGVDAGQVTDLAGFQTPEELANGFKQVSGQVKELESLKGRQGNELGALRQQVAIQQGKLEGMQEAMSSRSQEQGPTESALYQQYEAGEIDMPTFLSQRDSIREGAIKKEFAGQLNQFKAQTDQEKYADQFIKDNPGYVEAYDAGALSEDMQKGYSAEHSWDRFKARELEGKYAELSGKMDEITKTAQQKGVQNGIKIEQGKKAAGSVLSGSGDPAARNTPSGVIPKTERVSAGVDLIRRMRSGQ